MPADFDQPLASFDDPTAGASPGFDDPTATPADAAVTVMHFGERPTAAAAPPNATLRRNLEAIALRSPRAARRIAEAGSAGELDWIDTDEGPSAVYRGAALASKRRPLSEAASLAGRIDLDEHGCVVWLGFGLGLHVDALRSRAGRAIVQVVFEPDVELLRAVLERVDYAELFRSRDVILLTEADAAGDAAATTKGSEGMIAIGVEVIEHPPSRRRLADETPTFVRTFAEIVEAVRMYCVTTMMQCDVTVRNQLMNAGPYLTAGGISQLKGARPAAPAVVVSAGPSLSRNVHLLEGFGVGSARENDLTIVATQTTLKPLLARGVRPHFVTALDYHEVSVRFYEGLTAEDVAGVTLIAEPKANPAIIDAFPGRTLFVEDATLNEMLDEAATTRPNGGPDAALPPGGTVAHLAYYVARHVGADPVVLIGQDLGFTDGQYYGDGAAIHDVWAGELSEFCSLESMEWRRIVRMRGHLRPATDASGRAMYTDSQMATYLAQFERDFLADADRGLTIVDATEGGVGKRSTTPMPLAAALERYEGSSAIEGEHGVGDKRDETFGDALFHVEHETPEARARIASARERLSSLRRDVRTVGRYSRETVKLLAKIERAFEDRSKVNDLIRKVHSVRDRVHGLPDAFALVQRLNQTGVFKRYKADRLLHLAEGMGEVEKQRRRVERDRMNVGWLADVAETTEELLDMAVAALDGKGKRTRDLVVKPGAMTGPGAREASGAAGARTVVIAAVLVGPNDVSAEGAGPALVETLRRVARVEGVSKVLVLNEGAEERAVEGAVEASGVRAGGGRRVVVEIATDERTEEEKRIAKAWRARTDRGRAYAVHAWRSGFLPTAFDAVLEPERLGRAIASAGSSGEEVGVLCVGGGWRRLDVAACGEVVERFVEGPEQHALSFSQAAAGTVGCVISRGVIEELMTARAAGNMFGSTAGMLGYVPVKPRQDPITKTNCVGVPASLRDAAAAWYETDAGAGDADDAGFSLVSELSFDVGGGESRGCARASWYGFKAGTVTRALAPSVVATVVGAASAARAERGGTAAPLVVTLRGVGGVDGSGDPCTHGGLGELIAAAREAGAAFVHVRTDLALNSTLDAHSKLGDALASADVVSVDLLAQTLGVYERITGRRSLEIAKASCGALWERWKSESRLSRLPERWLTPRLTRCDATYEEVEAFFDAWTLTVGGAVIDPLPRVVEGERIGPLTTPRLERLRRSARLLCVRSDGGLLARPEHAADGEVTPVRGEDAGAVIDAWRAVAVRRAASMREGER